jgi:hypothetical protein
VSNIISTEKPAGKWPVGGYAPGNYACKCHYCEKTFFGDKRAIECADCVIQKRMMYKTADPDPQPTPEFLLQRIRVALIHLEKKMPNTAHSVLRRVLEAADSTTTEPADPVDVVALQATHDFLLRHLRAAFDYLDKGLHTQAYNVLRVALRETSGPADAGISPSAAAKVCLAAWNEHAQKANDRYEQYVSDGGVPYPTWRPHFDLKWLTELAEET